MIIKPHEFCRNEEWCSCKQCKDARAAGAIWEKGSGWLWYLNLEEKAVGWNLKTIKIIIGKRHNRKQRNVNPSIYSKKLSNKL